MCIFPENIFFKKSLDSLPGVQWVLDSRMLLSDTSDNDLYSSCVVIDQLVRVKICHWLRIILKFVEKYSIVLPTEKKLSASNFNN